MDKNEKDEERTLGNDGKRELRISIRSCLSLLPLELDLDEEEEEELEPLLGRA